MLDVLRGREKKSLFHCVIIFYISWNESPVLWSEGLELERQQGWSDRKALTKSFKIQVFFGPTLVTENQDITAKAVLTVIFRFHSCVLN